MGSFVFVVDKFSYPVHRSRGFCGVKNPLNDNSRYSLYADIMNVRKGDIVFFYQRRIDEPRWERGFRGIFEVVSEPFFDTEDVRWGEYVVLGKCPFCGEPFSEVENDKGIVRCPICQNELKPGNHILPNRVLIHPKEYYEKPVDDNTAYINHTNHGMLWTMLFRKVFGPGRERSVTPILPEEAQKLIRLLKRVNEGKTSDLPFEPYKPSKESKQLKIDLGKGPTVPYENILMAWFSANIDKDHPSLKEIIGPKEELEFWGNNVLYGIGGEKVDFLCTHKRDGVRYKATVIELKKDRVDENSINQIKDYSYWISQLVTAYAEPKVKELILQPVVIGYRVSQSALNRVDAFKPKTLEIPYLDGPCKVSINPLKIAEYEVKDGEITFQIKKLPRGLTDFL